jgi:hypothetical protein
MSGEADSNIEPIVVYVKLTEEGTPVYRPTKAAPVGDSLARLLEPAGYDPDDEHWEFDPGTLIRYEERRLEGSDVLVAVQRA